MNEERSIVDITQFFEQNNTAPDMISSFEEALRLNCQSKVDFEHSRLLLKYNMYLSSNGFLDLVSKDIADFCNFVMENNKDITLTIRGRIKSIVRLEEKFNGYVMEYCSQYYSKHQEFPTEAMVVKYLGRIRDIIAYRIIISIPEKNLKGRKKSEQELIALYQIANYFPSFFTKLGYSMEDASSIKDGLRRKKKISLLSEENKRFFKDYVDRPKKNGYKSLHISLKDNRPIKGLPLFSNVEVQMRTFEMDCFTELGDDSKHEIYEKRQAEKRENQELPLGICKYYDCAVARYNSLHNYDFTKAKIDHFKAIRLQDGSVVFNDHAGVKFGREIDPREYLS